MKHLHRCAHHSHKYLGLLYVYPHSINFEYTCVIRTLKNNNEYPGQWMQMLHCTRMIVYRGQHTYTSVYLKTVVAKNNLSLEINSTKTKITIVVQICLFCSNECIKIVE